MSRSLTESEPHIKFKGHRNVAFNSNFMRMKDRNLLRLFVLRNLNLNLFYLNYNKRYQSRNVKSFP